MGPRTLLVKAGYEELNSYQELQSHQLCRKSITACIISLHVASENKGFNLVVSTPITKLPNFPAIRYVFSHFVCKTNISMTA